MGIIPSSSFKHFVSNFIIAKGAFGYADGVAYYHSEMPEEFPVITTFFSNTRNSWRNHAITVHEFFQWQIWCSKLNSMPYISLILRSRNLEWTFVVKIGLFESETQIKQEARMQWLSYP